MKMQISNATKLSSTENSSSAEATTETQKLVECCVCVISSFSVESKSKMFGSMCGCDIMLAIRITNENDFNIKDFIFTFVSLSFSSSSLHSVDRIRFCRIFFSNQFSTEANFVWNVNFVKPSPKGLLAFQSKFKMRLFVFHPEKRCDRFIPFECHSFYVQFPHFFGQCDKAKLTSKKKELLFYGRKFIYFTFAYWLKIMWKMQYVFQCSNDKTYPDKTDEWDRERKKTAAGNWRTTTK